jgi:hypothetical protein
MSSLPQLHSQQRAPRAHLAGVTPAVLRFQDGRRTSGRLQLLSLTGGLLSLSNLLVQGSQVKLMFLTGTGAVLGGAEMLSPVTSTLQPFRFISLTADDQRRLGATIQASLYQDNAEQQWIEKFRAASVHGNGPRRRLFKLVIGAVGLAALGLASAVYLLHFHLLK